jgi:hypothetical protein
MVTSASMNIIMVTTAIPQSMTTMIWITVIAKIITITATKINIVS